MPPSCRRAPRSSSAAVILPPSRSPTRRLRSLSVSGRSLAKSRLSTMFARRPGADTGGSSTAESPAGSPDEAVAGSISATELAASSAISGSATAGVCASQSAAGGGPTCVSPSSSLSSPNVWPSVPPGEVGSSSETATAAAGSFFFLRFVILLLGGAFALLPGGVFGHRGCGGDLAGRFQRYAGSLRDEQGLVARRLEDAHDLESGHLEDRQQRHHDLMPQLGLRQRQIEAGLELERTATVVDPIEELAQSIADRDPIDHHVVG